MHGNDFNAFAIASTMRPYSTKLIVLVYCLIRASQVCLFA